MKTIKIFKLFLITTIILQGCCYCEKDKYPDTMPYFSLDDKIVYKSSINTFDTFYVVFVDEALDEVPVGPYCKQLHSHNYTFVLDTVNTIRYDSVAIVYGYYYDDFVIDIFGFWEYIIEINKINKKIDDNLPGEDIYYCITDSLKSKKIIDTVFYHKKYGILQYTTSDSIKWILYLD